MPCLKGLAFTVNAILCAYLVIQHDFPDFELAAGLCNQYSLQHLFSKLRQRGGLVSNPTARMVRLGLRHILSSGKIEGGGGANVAINHKNLEMLLNTTSDVEKAFGQNDENLFSKELEETEIEDDHKDIQMTAEAIENGHKNLIHDKTEVFKETGDEEFKSNETEHSKYSPPEISFYDRNAVAFFAGYIASKCFLKRKCENCRASMMKTAMEPSQDNEVYIRLREYPNLDEDAPDFEKLTRPTNQFTNIIYEELQAFKSVWEKYWASDKLMQHFSREAEERINQHFPEWLQAD